MTQPSSKRLVTEAAQLAALATKAPLASPAFTGTPTGISKTHVGLGNVDNTSDANKPVSTAQAAAVAAAKRAVYDPKDYGAAFDGSTDDSAAVQSAIDAAGAAGGGIVQLPGQGAVSNTAKRIKINSTLIVKTGVWLRGVGSTTVLSGTANPMISLPTSGSVVDRVTISDLFLQTPTGVGVKVSSVGTTGGYQLGWPRITVENVTVVDAGSHAFHLENSGVIEARLVNCASLRAAGHGFLIGSTDNFVIGCTAAQGSSASFSGFFVQGGNNKLTACKGYGNAGHGFDLAGAGRHVISGCEAQDNALYGYNVSGSWNTLGACLADTNLKAGFNFSGNDNTASAVAAMTGGGGSGYTTQVGFRFDLGASRNRVDGVSNSLVHVAGSVVGNAVSVKGGGAGRQVVTYAATVTPDPYLGETVSITLTGPLTLTRPGQQHVGQRITFELRQDATGGRTVTFADSYRLASGWAASTAANTIDTVTFEFDGLAWLQVNGSGMTPRPDAGVSDTFNRSDAAVGTSSSGHVWGTYNQDATTWQVVSNQAGVPGTANFRRNVAWLESGRVDVTVRAGTLSGNAGIVFRLVDSNNYYEWNGNTLQKRVAGVVTNIASGLPNIASGAYVVLNGATITLWSGYTLGVFTDTSLLTGTKHGVSVQLPGDRVDDFAIS